MTDPVVQAHLRTVVTTLRTVPVDPRRAAARTAALDALDAYADAGRFPRPSGPVTARLRRVQPPRAFAGPGVRAPIFEDAHGTRCAVGHLLGLSRPDLVARVRDADNGVHLPELDAPEVDAWAAEHGFTRDELAWIQPGYCWELPECDEVVLETPAPVTAACEGPDVSLRGDMTIDCQVCDGPFRAWALVANFGSAPAAAGTVTLGSGDTAYDTVAYAALEPGASVYVGPLEAPDVTSVNGSGWLLVTPSGEDCFGDEPYTGVWELGNGGPGTVAPEACDGGCDTGGGLLGGDGGCGCATETTGTTGAAAALGWLGVMGLGLVRGRRVAGG